MKRVLFLLFFVGIAFSCEKELYTTIPAGYPVRIELWLETRDSDLKAKLAFKKFEQRRTDLDRLGYGGILVINGIGDLINLYAYDLACPVEIDYNIKIVPDKSGITATCPECGAVFIIADGSGMPQSGTKYSLRPYRVRDNKNGTYTVTN